MSYHTTLRKEVIELVKQKKHYKGKIRFLNYAALRFVLFVFTVSVKVLINVDLVFQTLPSLYIKLAHFRFLDAAVVVVLRTQNFLQWCLNIIKKYLKQINRFNFFASTIFLGYYYYYLMFRSSNSA